MPHVALLLAGYLFALPNAPADVDSFWQEGTRLAAARVKNWSSGYHQPGPAVSGTGTLTAVDGEAGLVLTAAHLFEGKVGPITVEFHDGQTSGARILAIDPQLDVAALWVYAPSGITPVPIANHNPDPGTPVEIWGFGPKRFRAFVAKIAKPIPLQGDVPDTLVAAQGVHDRQVTIPGDSGGAMISRGKLVAVHWGYRGSESDPRRSVHALGCDTIKQWLQSNLSRSLYRHCLASAN